MLGAIITNTRLSTTSAAHRCRHLHTQKATTPIHSRLRMIEQLPIFPCDLAKHPLTAHGFKDARRGADWKGWPLVGFPTGAVSGIDVLDIDPRGRDWYDAN